MSPLYLSLMGDEFQECSGCKLVKHVNNFDGFKNCHWCREHSRLYREKNKDKINRQRRMVHLTAEVVV